MVAIFSTGRKLRIDLSARGGLLRVYCGLIRICHLYCISKDDLEIFTFWTRATKFLYSISVVCILTYDRNPYHLLCRSYHKRTDGCENMPRIEKPPNSKHQFFDHTQLLLLLLNWTASQVVDTKEYQLILPQLFQSANSQNL